MEPQWRPLREPAANQVWQQVLRPVAAELRVGAGKVAELIVQLYQAEAPEVVPDASAVAEQMASTEAALHQVAQCIDIGLDPCRAELAPATAAFARSSVQRNISLNELIRSVRLAQRQLWQWLFDQITEAGQPEDHGKALELVTNWLFAYIDDFLAQAEHAYAIEREAWLGGAAAARASAVDDILAGREHDPQRASTRLRYDINRHHVGVQTWLNPAHDVGGEQSVLAEALSQLARAVSAQSTLVHPARSMAIAAWITRPHAYAIEDLKVVQDEAGTLLPGGVRIAIGEPGWGIIGFRRSHVEASHARRVASLLGERAGLVTCYRDVAVAALGCADAEYAIAFVRRVLGPLAADDETTYRIAGTLAVYLEENRSPAKAAHRLSVHPNTISYRINQAEGLLGRPIDANTVELSVALALLPALPGLIDRRTAQL